RVYTMTVVATDVCGNSTVSNPFEVGVWHDRAHGPTTGTIYSATAGSNTTDTRNGTDGTYGTGCGPGMGATCGETGQAASHPDPEMEITQQASIDVSDLQIEKASGNNVRLTWTDPSHQAGINVTRFHVYRLDPETLFWTLIAEVTKQTTSFEDPVLIDGDSYQ